MQRGKKRIKMQHAARRGPQGSAGFRNDLFRFLLCHACFGGQKSSKHICVIQNFVYSCHPFVESAFYSPFIQVLVIIIVRSPCFSISRRNCGISKRSKHPLTSSELARLRRPVILCGCASKVSLGVGLSFGFNQYYLTCFLLYLGLSLFFSSSSFKIFRVCFGFI